MIRIICIPIFITLTLTLALAPVSCAEDITIPVVIPELKEVSLEPAFVPCNKTIDEAIRQYADTTWTAEGIKDFIQSTWRFHDIQTLQSDTVIPVNMEFERELRFSEYTFKAYEPYDVFRGEGEFLIEPTSPESDFFRIKVTTNESAIGGFVPGRIVPCNSDFILYTSYIDRGDRFYRKVE